MRAKKTKSVDSTIVKKAWDRVFDGWKLEDIETLHREGWRHCKELSIESGHNFQLVFRRMSMLCDKGVFEKKSANILLKDRVRLVTFFRPIKK